MCSVRLHTSREQGSGVSVSTVRGTLIPFPKSLSKRPSPVPVKFHQCPDEKSLSGTVNFKNFFLRVRGKVGRSSPFSTPFLCPPLRDLIRESNRERPPGRQTRSLTPAQMVVGSRPLRKRLCQGSTTTLPSTSLHSGRDFRRRS